MCFRVKESSAIFIISIVLSLWVKSLLKWYWLKGTKASSSPVFPLAARHSTLVNSFSNRKSLQRGRRAWVDEKNWWHEAFRLTKLSVRSFFRLLVDERAFEAFLFQPFPDALDYKATTAAGYKHEAITKGPLGGFIHFFTIGSHWSISSKIEFINSSSRHKNKSHQNQ